MIQRVRNERGAAILLMTISLLVLFGFAALAVDLGAAWSQRRTSQSIADASVMAGAVEYLEASSPSSSDIVDIVRDYASRNGDIPADSPDWLSCLDPDGIADGFTPMTDADGNTIQCISLKQGDTGLNETLLRVKVPDRIVKTSFASVIGFDSISVGAFAVAEIVFSEQSSILPLSLPSNYGSEECLGTPPSGQLKSGELVSCTGPDSGNFGLLDSPFFEDHDLNGSPLSSCPGDPNFNTRAPFNIAVGIDHAIQPWPASEGPIPSGDLSPKPTGADTCDADTAPPEVPYVMNTQTGNRDLIQGLVGPGLYDGKPGRLRQSGGIGTQLAFASLGDPDFSLDNVGLWEYLATPTGSGVDARCTPANYGSGASEGRQATDDIIACLSLYRSDTAAHPEFAESLLTSPRFALVPVLSYTRGNMTGNEWRAIVELIPVYLHTTWYDCGNGSDPYCRFKPADFDQADPDDVTILFNPGEGTTSPVIPLKKGGYTTPNSIDLEGFTALVIEWDWLIPDAKNQIGENAPLAVSLYR